MADRISIVGELISAAERLVAASKPVYVHDPKHENKPKGGGWHRTSKGWSSIPKTRMAPIGLGEENDSKPSNVDRLPSRKNTIPRTKLAPISFDDDKPAAPRKTVRRRRNMPEIPAPNTIDQEIAYPETENVCSSLIDKGADISRVHSMVSDDGYVIRFNMDGIPSKCLVRNEFMFDDMDYHPSYRFMQGSRDIGSSVDSFMQNRIKPSKKEAPFEQTRRDLSSLIEDSGWRTGNISRGSDGTILCSMSGKARGDSQDMWLEIGDGEVSDSENFPMKDDFEIFCKSHGIRNMRVKGYTH